MRILFALLAAVAMAAWLLSTHRVTVPPRWDPFAPLDIAEPPNFLTRFKQMRAARDDAMCRAAVEASGYARASQIPDRSSDAGCSIDNAFAVTAFDGAAVPRFVATCRLTVALSLWLRHVVQPAAERTLGTRVVRLEHFGSYACRNIYHRDSGPRSRHATADAVDIAGFVMADGRRIPVTDWTRDTPEARFLRAARDGACRFAGVLGPDYNQAHANHLHVEVGGYGICR